jgi:hypothetical protein
MREAGNTQLCLWNEFYNMVFKNINYINSLKVSSSPTPHSTVKILGCAPALGYVLANSR